MTDFENITEGEGGSITNPDLISRRQIVKNK